MSARDDELTSMEVELFALFGTTPPEPVERTFRQRFGFWRAEVRARLLMAWRVLRWGDCGWCER